MSEPFMEPSLTLSDGIWSCPGFTVLGNRVGGAATVLQNLPMAFFLAVTC